MTVPYKIWCERPMPERFLPLLQGIATIVDEPMSAQAVVATARVRYDAALFAKMPTLKVIARTGIGCDNISLPDATARHIAVCNVPDGPTVSTAEHTLALLLAVTKKVKQAEARLHRGEKGDFFSGHNGIELAGKTFGLVGFGRIGRRVAQLASSFRMRMMVYDPFARADGYAQAASLDELLRAADVLSLHLPLTNDTHHLIDASKLKMLKRGAFLINTARGGIVDEPSLLAALENGHLQGAGLDVFEHEPPPPDHPLLNRDDVVATPHIAAATDSAKELLWRTALTQLLQVLRGERPPHLVNPEVWK
ncbi:MAG: hydroxyacid dehydrogenase [Verrucomicrobia bacterium]|nr:hydroxyacid dehydrogenase [Verrucomicrobiota bacterium]